MTIPLSLDNHHRSDDDDDEDDGDNDDDEDDRYGEKEVGGSFKKVILHLVITMTILQSN